MTQLDSLISKGALTGEQVGRIFLRDFARFMDAFQNNQKIPKEKFSESEKQVMVNSLTEAYDIKQYNTYIGIIQFLQKTGLLYTEQFKQLKYLFVSLLQEIETCKRIKTVALLLADAPLILTEPQYNRLKKEDLESKLALKTSVAGIILTATHYYFKESILEPQRIQKGKTPEENMAIMENEAYAVVKKLKVDDKLTTENIYELMKKAPYTALFEAYKKQPLTNPKFKKDYWQEGINGHYETPDGESSKGLSDDEWTKICAKWFAKSAETGIDYLKWVNDSREAPPETTKYEILEYLEGFFNMGSDTTQEDFEAFKKDYPDIYEAILKELQGIKGLEIDKIKPEEYAKPLISYKTLYGLDLPYYQQFFRFDPKDGESFIAEYIAVIPNEELKHWSAWKKEHYLDKNGNYSYQLSDHEKHEITQALPLMLEKASDHLKYIYAIQELYRILGEQIGEESISELAKDKIYFTHDKETIKEVGEMGILPNTLKNWFIERINDDIEGFKKLLRKTSLVIDKETIKEIHDLVNALKPIKIQDLRPKKDDIEKVKELTKNLTYYGQQGLKLHDILMGFSIGVENE